MSGVTCIVCHHKGNLIYQAIHTLLQNRGVEFEIIIATSVQEFKYVHPKVRVLHIHGGPTNKRNIATRFAKFEFVAFFDDDIQADEAAIVELYEACKQPGIGMCFGKLKNMEFRNRFDEAGGFLTWTGFIWSRAESHIRDVGQFDRVEPIFAGKSAACIIRRKLFWRVGAFDTSFEILGEESDLAWRVWIAGQKVLFVPWSVCWHAFNTKFKPVDFYTNQRIYFNGCRNYITMLAANLERWNLIKILPFHICVWIAAGIGMILTGKFKSGYNIFRGLAYVFGNLWLIKQKREKVRSIRVRTDKQLFKYIYKNTRPSYYFTRFKRYLSLGLHG